MYIQEVVNSITEQRLINQSKVMTVFVNYT